MAEDKAPMLLASFVKVVLAETEDVWNQVFYQLGMDYPEPRLELF